MVMEELEEKGVGGRKNPALPAFSSDNVFQCDKRALQKGRGVWRASPDIRYLLLLNNTALLLPFENPNLKYKAKSLSS